MPVIDRIREAGIVLPSLEVPAALFVPYTLHRGVLTVSGQLPMVGGKAFATGRVPDDVSLDTAREAARHCVANVLGWVAAATGGDLERVQRVLRIGGFVATSAGFHDAPAVVNAASELINFVFGDKGKHARIAIGVASLPFCAPVEIEATFALAVDA
ncbi:YjgF family translation initiation inhibitor [Cupriavidus gilardii CR3]|uniref:RidA family protein n=1 Tax=Cupriavidus gilardii TaxID=82541 RepID=A0A849BDM1_9BURK|nr:RidA family protein [Cupriavidus gilardii]ALD93123.1 YjgF family translation initiation inhibitor [Cupriavidus gilardii CR3]KAB0599465.1 RidA family protein [Cupriavidus gilardii]MCT9013034.1 RidA family protein [Cupriavidus gilardii]MCT9052588.1 RidA family protein [Cupriavidus gilardii]NNH10717.1 RidA family protein [Cupriavidus gilardii]